MDRQGRFRGTGPGCQRPQLRAATHEALFGLLAVSGMRVGEAVGLDRDDVAFDRHHFDLPRYLGHVSPADTYWYFSASPELMALAADRLDIRFGAGR